MKSLLILRHAKAADGGSGLPDFDRALNERGRREAQAVGEFLRLQNLRLDLVLSSPALRARETAETVVSIAGLPGEVRFDKRIYEASWPALFALFSEIGDAVSAVMLVGHNPALEDLIFTLTGRPEHLSPATIVKINFDVEQWDDVSENTGTIDWRQSQTN